MRRMKYIILTIAVEREGPYYVATCRELGTSSFGATEDEAIAATMDASELYLNTLEDLAECTQVLKEKGVTVYQGPAVGPRIESQSIADVRPFVLNIPHRACA
jgi:predicted RNase H-like HicB family nuclease